jgi:hypothetical protein
LLLEEFKRGSGFHDEIKVVSLISSLPFCPTL